MNDLVLTALINLFALFCTSANLERERAKGVLYNYLARFFGIRNHQEYIDLFDTLCDFYEMSAPDETKIVSQVCGKLKGEIPEESQSLLLLRLMEFSALNIEAYNGQQHLFELVAETFGVKQTMLQDFKLFVEGKPDRNVGVSHLEEQGITLKVLRIPEYNKVVVSYTGAQQLFMNNIQMLPSIYMPWEKNGIIKCQSGAPIYYNYIDDVLLGSAARHNTLLFCGEDVNFRFKKSDNGLHDFTFSLHDGELVAIMGGSGAGKSTLMSILNGTLKPKSGSITINGEELYDDIETAEYNSNPLKTQNSKLKDLIGFVPQDDLLIAELTVYQNLLYTARFCFADMKEEELDRRVLKVLQELDLIGIKDLRVGSPLNKTISGGQRKRLNIALELIREPQILFLDEPTSGLSSADSEKVIHLLKAQTYQGKLVITCIHQPSSDIYKLFDRLWLLDRGGYPIYDGNPIEAISVFKRAANYADAERSICEACGNINPEILLNIVEAKALDSNGQFTEKRKVEPQEWHEIYRRGVAKAPENAEKKENIDIIESVDNIENVDNIDKIENIENLEKADKIDKAPHFPKAEKNKKPSPFRQFAIYLRRNFHTKLQDKQFLLIALFEAPLLAFIVAMLTRYSGDDGYTLYDNKNLLSYMFMAVIVATFMGMSVSAEEIFKDRLLLKRESFLQLNYASYIASKVTTAAIISAFQTLMFIVVGNSLLGIHCLFWQWWAVMFTASFLASLTGLFLSQRLKSIVAIYITIPLLLIPQILLCGVVVAFEDLDQHSKTNNVPLVGELIPSRWAFEALAVTMFTDNDYEKDYFNNEKMQYELFMARFGIIKKLKELNEQEWLNRKKQYDEYGEHFLLIPSEMKKLSDKWGLEEFTERGYNSETYDAINAWLDKADKQLYKQSVKYSKAIDRDKRDYIDQYGNKALVALQRDNTNKQLIETLRNSQSDKMVRVEGDVLVPVAGIIYLDPPQHRGRAPFYSSVKIIGDTRFQTLQFNLAVMILMCLLAIGVLLTGKPKI